MKITPRPVSFSDPVDQSRDIAGLNKWRQSSRTIGFIMFVLGWFTIPVEVMLRRDFGQRWFTVVNFYSGLFLLLIFATLQYVAVAIGAAIQSFFYGIASAINPFQGAPEPSISDRIMDKSMLFFLLAYITLGSYHLFNIWWRNRTNTALHSFDDGSSRIEPLAGYVVKALNTFSAPLVRVYVRLLPKKQRLDMQIPQLINDKSAFTNTVFEPLILFLLAFLFHGITSAWLFISAIALAIHANWKETAKLNKVLDFRDSIVEAKVMMHLKNEAENPKGNNTEKKTANITVKDTPQIVPHTATTYPDVSEIIEAIERERVSI